MMKNVFIILLILLNTNIKAQLNDSVISRLKGKWDWTYTADGWGNYNSPQLAGYTKSVVLSQVSNDNHTDTLSYTLFKNDTVINYGRTYISDLNSWGGNIHANIIGEDSMMFNASGYFYFFLETPDTVLQIGPPALDANVHTYRKDTLFNNINLYDQDKKNINIYPNPASKFIYIELNNKKVKASIDFINMIGQKIITYEMANTNFARIDIGLLPKGLYLLQIKMDIISINKKLLIMASAN